MSERQKKPFYNRWWLIVLTVIVAIGAIGCNGEEPKSVNDKQEQKEVVSDTVALDVDEKPEASSSDKVKEVTETLSQKNAVRTAKNYLSFTFFSKKGLIEQLEYEGYSNEDAVYAVNQLNVDWKKQAVKKAEEYLNLMPFSRSGLIEQLEYEGFTNEEATYAVEQIGL